MNEGSSRLRVIQAGVARHGASWIDNTTTRCDEAELVAIVDINADALAAASDRHGIAADRRFGDLAEALSAVEADAVVSVTPPPVHLPHAELTFAAGLHLLVEKPIADDIESAKRMVELAEAAGRQLHVSQNRRWDADVLTFKRVFDDRPVGELGHGHIDFYLPWDFTGTFRETMPHVLLVDMSVHHLDNLRWITGRDVTRVTAASFNPPWSWYQHGAALKLLLELDDGTPFSYSGDWSARGRYTSWQGDWRLQCAEGSVHFEGGRTSVARCPRRPSEQPEIKPFNNDEHPPSQMSSLLAFVEACRTGRPSITGGRDNLRTIATVFAALTSSQERRAVEVAEVLKGRR